MKELYRYLSPKQKKHFRITAMAKLLELGLLRQHQNVKNIELWAKIETAFGVGNVLKTLGMRIGERAKKRVEKRKTYQNFHDFYESNEWKKLRYQALVQHGAACQCCGATRADGIKLHVDHIKPRSKYPHLELVLENLQVLCERCNMGKSATDQTDWRDHPPGLGRILWVD